MPVDLTVLYNTPGFLSFHNRNYNQISGEEDDETDTNNNGVINTIIHGGSSLGSLSPQHQTCRRAASFPTFSFHKHHSLATVALVSKRCLSESNIKNDSKAVLNGLTLQDLKRQFAALVFDQVERRIGGEDVNCGSHIEKNNESDAHLIVTTQDDNQQVDNVETHLCVYNKKPKKKVSFADDTGQMLANIRIMAEPSDVPPILTSTNALALIAAHDPDPSHFGPSFIAGSLFGASSINGVINTGAASTFQQMPLQGLHHDCYHWQLDFSQPASDYLKFRERLNKNNVVLENVLLNNDCGRLAGTVKVKNVAFEKLVFLRYTCDRWKTYFDERCAYVQPVQHRGNMQQDSIDTFCFDFPIPADDAEHPSIELCVCYKAASTEFWDSNENGQNFKLISRIYSSWTNKSLSMQNKSRSDSSLLNHIDSGDEDSNEDNSRKTSLELLHGSGASTYSKRHFHRRSSSDAFELELDNWAEFSTWKHLDVQGPYY